MDRRDEDSDSESESRNNPSNSPGVSPPLDDDASQEALNDVAAASGSKRRRVTRACDECRKKKIKCDGRQPCTHCTVYSYDCTYDQPSHRRRNPAPMVLAAMEQKVRRAEALVKAAFPDVANIDDPRVDELLAQKGLLDSNTAAPAPLTDPRNPQSSQNDQNLESMIQSMGSMELDKSGTQDYYDYYGTSSGMAFLRRMKEEMGDLFESAGPNPASSAEDIEYAVLNGPKPKSEEEDAKEVSLPPKAAAKHLCRHALDDACVMMPIIHQPSFLVLFDRIYDNPKLQNDNKHQPFLSLIYTMLALGCIFSTDEDSILSRKGYAIAAKQGYRYFQKARELIDIADCRDITSLQAIVLMILFLQNSAKLNTCYSYIGVALRSALRMGLHRSFPGRFNPIEAETRKRVFWVIRKLDVFVGAMLGLPVTLNNDDVDQEFPTEVEDSRITTNGIGRDPKNHVPLIVAANADYRLATIVSKMMKTVYPTKGFQNSKQDKPQAYRINQSLILDIERDLQKWKESLPAVLKPGPSSIPGQNSPQMLKVRLLLRMSYAYVQMMLYRPFLHYITPRMRSKFPDQKPHPAAVACVGVAENIIEIAAEMNSNGLLVGPTWFTMYATFFSVLSLVFCHLEQVGLSEKMLDNAQRGKQTLEVLGKTNESADRCHKTLALLFERMANSPRNQPLSPPVKYAVPAEPNSSAVSQTTTQRPTKAAQSKQRQMSQLTQQQQKQQAQPLPGVNPTFTPHPNNPFNPMMAHTPHPMASMAQQLSQPPGQGPMHALPAQSHAPNTFSDLAMMFPSSDPLAYPNQPMLTLESRGDFFHFGQPQPQPHPQHHSGHGPPMPGQHQQFDPYLGPHPGAGMLTTSPEDPSMNPGMFAPPGSGAGAGGPIPGPDLSGSQHFPPQMMLASNVEATMGPMGAPAPAAGTSPGGAGGDPGGGPGGWGHAGSPMQVQGLNLGFAQLLDADWGLADQSKRFG